jgi:hypothetical protein
MNIIVFFQKFYVACFMSLAATVLTKLEMKIITNMSYTLDFSKIMLVT